MAVEYLSEEAFFALPQNKPAQKTDDFWDPIIGALGEGKIVKIQFQEEKEKRGRRLALGRRSKRAGFTVEIRYGDGFLAARRAGDVSAEAETGGRTATRRRRKSDD